LSVKYPLIPACVQ